MFDPTSNIRPSPIREDYRKTASGRPQNFQKIMRKEEGDEHGASSDREKVNEEKESQAVDSSYDAIAAQAAGKEPKKKIVSLFDLAKTSETQAAAAVSTLNAPVENSDDEYVSVKISEEMKRESLSALFNGYATPEKLKGLLTGNETVDGSIKIFTLSGNLTTDEEIAAYYLKNEKGREPIQFTTREQPDLSSINPLAANTFAIEPSSNVEAPAPPRTVSANIQEIVDQIIANLYTLSRDGKTETLVTLKHPPLFDGANLVIKAFDSAKGEFNISFENLTQAAKQILDARDSQNSLRLALEDKGFVVHIITATTITETLNVAKGEEPSRDNREGGGGKDERQQREEREEREET